MEIPRLLLNRIRDPACPEDLACSAISQLAKNKDYQVEEVFPVLVLAYRTETRRTVLEAYVRGIVETLARVTHADFVKVQLANFLSDRSDRTARVLVAIIQESGITQGLRVAALDRLSLFREEDLSEVRLNEVEFVLNGRLSDQAEASEVKRYIEAAFGNKRRDRPRVETKKPARDDDTLVIH